MSTWSRRPRPHRIAALTSALAAALLGVGVVVPAASPVAAATVITTTYSYTGSTQSFVVPSGVTSITVTLKGGQGGKGGGDSQGVPTPGGYQGVVTGTVDVTPGQTVTVAVGGGGGTGVSSQGSAAGGSAGLNPLAGYDGAVGGVAGPQGSSGGGGGSGAASVLRVGGVDIVAAGAGGNGGNGQFLPIVGRRAEDNHVARPDTVSTDGRPGMNTSLACSVGFSCDGGASGAGGGGAQGGERGAVQYGGATATEYFGFGGYPGANSTAGLSGLVASYDYYAANSANGSIVISYDDGAPGAPVNLAGTTRTNAIDLTWDAPLSSGSAAITDYVVEYATAVGGPFTVFADGVSTTRATTVTGLTNGTAYFFRVAAVNSIGTGATAATTVGVVPSDVPARPTVTGLVPYAAGIHVDFTPGASHSPITGYEYRLDGGAWTVGTVSGNRLSIPGLVNGTAYAVEIRAVNVIGAGAASTPAQSATPRDVPQAPTGLLATGGDTTIALTWTAPVVDNGSPLTDYAVQTATSAGGPFTTFADGTSTTAATTVTGRTNGTTYWVRVGAVNAVGTGAWTAPVAVTPYTIPAAPSVSLAPADGSLHMTITPGSTGGSAVTRWEYRVDGAGEWHGTGTLSTSFTLDGLVNGTSYGVEVRATNAAGTGPASSPVSASPRTVAAAPSIAAIALDSGAVDVAFGLGNDGGSTVTNVEYSIDGGTTWIPRSPASTASPLTIGGLTGGQTYDVILRTVNAAGASDASNTSTVTAKGTPAAPDITVVPGDRSLTVSFDEPTNGGAPISGYEYSLDDGDTWTPRAPSSLTSPLVITGLTNGTTYAVQLRAINAVGSGAASGTSNATPRTTPGAPSIVGGTVAGVGDLDVDFTAPVADGGSPITTYQYSTDGGLTWRVRDDGTTGSPLTITTLSSDGTTSLTGAVVYPVEIRAMNAAGAGAASAVADGMTTTVPAAPTIVDVGVSDRSARVVFDPPANGGSAILRYEYSVDGGDTWTDTGSLGTSFRITGLDNATTYALLLRAVNGVGDGASSTAEAFTIATRPGAPSISTITPGDGTLTVAFAAPVDDGGSAVTGYQYSTDGGATWRTRATGSTASPLVIAAVSAVGAAPLANATLYPVQVRAVNASGAGSASNTLLAAPRGAPEAPTSAVLDAGDGTLSISFTLGGDGGSPITRLEYQLDGGVWTTAGSIGSPVTVAGLVNGQPHTLAVRAVNSIGAGAASATLTGTPRTSPGAPGSVAATASAGQVSVSWDVPADDGGAPITGYTVAVYAEAAGGSPIGTCSTTSALTCAVTSLTNGTTVYVQVVASNAAGGGLPSSPRVAATPLSAPQVSIGSIAPGPAELAVTVQVTDDGGAPITAYEYQLDGGAWAAAPAAASPFTISGLTTGHTYAVRIRATNLAGTGAASASVDATPRTVPGTPSALAASSAPASAVLSWSVPATDGGQPITDYVVQYATSAGGPFSTFADGTSTAPTATVTGLTDATTYYFRVAAVNTAGTSGWSSLASTTPRSAPSAPTITTITPGGRYLQVAFSAPSSNGGAAVTGYEYRLDGGTWRTAAGTTSPITITGLTNGQTYAVELRAVNTVGGGTASNTVSSKPYGLPSAIVGFRATPSGNTVTLDWDAVNDNGSAITAYNVIRWSAATEGSISASFTTTATTYTVPSLSNGTYYFTIEATNAAGTGPRSAPRTTAIVGATLPAAPTLGSVDASASQATLAWTAGAAGTSAITGYLVQHSTDGTTWTTLTSGSTATSATVDLPTPGTPAILRVAAVSAAGTGAFATVRPPLAITDVVTTAGTTTATVDGSVNANTGTASVSIEYATSASALGTGAATLVAATPSSATGSSATAVTASLTDLQPGTAYVARVIATVGSTRAVGATRSFTTRATITSSGLTPTYTGAPAVISTVTSPASLPVVRTFVGIGGTTYASSTTAPTDVGTYQVTTTIDGDIPGEEVATLTIVAKPITVTVAADDRDYDGTTAATLTLGLDGAVDGDDVAADATSLRGTFTDADAGDDKRVDLEVLGALLTGTDAGNYSASVTDHVTASIARLAQTVSFDSAPPAPAVVGATYTPAASSSAALTVTLSITSGEGVVCSWSAGHVTFLAAGTCVLRADQAGTTNVLAAPSVEQSITVVTPPTTTTTTTTPPTTTPTTTPPSTPPTTTTPTTVPPATTVPEPASDLALALDLQVGDSASGAPVNVSGTGLRPWSIVRIELHSDPVLLGTVMTDGNGSFTATVHLPAVVPPGSHHVVATGETPAGTALAEQAPLFVDWSGTIGWIEPAGPADPANPAAPTGPTGTPSAPGAPSPSGYVPLAPTRVLDTRNGDGKVEAGRTYRLELPATLVPADATSIVVNLAVDGPAGDGFVTVHPCSAARPLAAALNFHAGEVVSDLVTAAYRPGSALCLFTTATTHLVVDLQGYHSSSHGQPLTALPPVRVMDTRTGDRPAGGTTVAIPVIGAGRAPAGSTAVLVHLAVDAPSRGGFLTAYPCGTAVPLAANLNFAAGQTRSNSAVVPVGEGGAICVYTSVTADIVVDLAGAAAPGGSTLFRALVSGRALDTRTTGTRPAAGSVTRLDLSAVPGIDAVDLYVAVDDPDGAGFVTAYACGTERPWVSSLNYEAGRVAGNHVSVAVGTDGQVCLYTLRATEIVVDVEGVHVGI